jgi:cysteine desulfurase
VPLDAPASGAESLTLGGGAMGAPAWSGALWLREGTRCHPLIEGGLEEDGRRGGPRDLPAIAGLGEAARLAALEMAGRARRARELGERLTAGLLRLPEVRVNGPRDQAERLPGHVQVGVGWVQAESLVVALGARGVACSPGSACTAGAGKPSPVLEAIGLEAPWTRSAVLFTARHTTTEDEIDRALAVIGEVVADLRAISPLAPR